MKDPQSQILSRKDPRIQTSAPTVLQKQDIAVWHEGELVKLKVGDTGPVLTFDYLTAFKVLELMRYHAKQAKGFAGDGMISWRTLAVLTDAEENDKRGF